MFKSAMAGKASLANKFRVAKLGRPSQRFMSVASQLADGEYLDEGTAMFIEEPIASFSQRRRYRKNGQLVDEIMEVELNKETLIETEAQMKERLDRFQGKLGVNFDQVKDSAATPAHLSGADSQYAKIQQVLSGMELDLKPAKVPALRKKRVNVISTNEEQAQLAFAKLELLREQLSSEADLISNLTMDDLRRSLSLRSLLLNYDLSLFRSDPNPRGSFKRVYDNKLDEEVAGAQAARQSSLMANFDRNQEVSEHNREMLQDFHANEEGLTPEPVKIDMKSVKRQIKEELETLKETQPEKAENLDKLIFGRDSDLDWALNQKIPEDEIKSYPGSIAGPEPEDDPESWAKWYYEHQPKSAFKDGLINGADLGVKHKIIKPKNDMATVGYGAHNHVYKNPVSYYLDKDQLYETWDNYEGRPEFQLFNKENFNVQEGTRNPEITFSSNVGPNDLPALQPDAPMMYQKLHDTLERWSVYRMLPQILKYDRAYNEFMGNVAKGLATVPSYEKERNQPSLWTYYETLPAWCRNNPLIRQTLFAFEYHKPHMDHRQKEIALNFVASMLRPVEGRFKDVITEVAISNKLRVTMDNGKHMMNELNFYTIDVADLGSDTEDDGDDEAAEKEFSRLLMGGLDEEEAAAKGNILEQVMRKLNKTDLDDERRKVYDEEMTITSYEMDPEVQKCMVDFPAKPYAKVDDIEAAKDIANENLVPVNYYDNDDGFWDEYIAAKQQSRVEAGFLSNRKWFKH